MKTEVSVKKIKGSQAEINVKLSEKAFEEYKKKALEEMGKNVKMKGFRPGHVPKDVLEKQVSKEAVLGLAIDMALDMTYREAIVSEKVEVMSRPEVKIEKEDPLEYTVTVAVKPEVKVKDYKKIKVSIKDAKVTKKEIEATVEDLLKGKGTWHDVDRKAKDGDRAEVDFQGYDGTKVEEGKELANTKSANHPLVLGGKSFVPGFEEAIVGMKVGETKEFTLTFPKDYHVDDFKSKKVTFKADLKRLEEQKIPEYNDEFIKEATNGTKNNKKEFEEYVEEVLMEKKKDEARGVAEGELIDKLIKATDLELAPQIVKQETEVIFGDYKKQIESKGIPFEKHMELTKKTEEELKKEMTKEAQKRVTMRFALDYIIAEEKFDVLEADLTKELEAIKARYPENEHEKIDAHYKEGTEGRLRLKNMMVVGKVFDMYFKK